MLLITNSAAGSSAEASIEAALEVLRASGEVEVESTDDADDLDRVLQGADSRTVVVAGGDGSLHAVVAALHRRDDLAGRTLALLPLGTGNDFARALDLPLEPEAAAAAIVSGRPRSMDILVDEEGGVVVNSVHVGASAQASRTGARWKKRLGPFGLGIIGYPIGAAMAAVNPPSVRLRVEVDGELVADVDKRILMVAVGNGTSVGGGAELTPDADPSDGKADVVILFATGPWARFGFAWHLRKAEHERRDDVLALRATRVEVSGEEFWVSADGELSGPEKVGSWEVQPGAYSMIVP
jgi:YegS/Rv2252/BmrU family lipid kinase